MAIYRHNFIKTFTKYMEVNQTFRYPYDPRWRLSGVKEELFKKRLKVSTYKVVSLYIDKNQKMIVIKKINGKIENHKRLNDEFMSIVSLICN